MKSYKSLLTLALLAVVSKPTFALVQIPTVDTVQFDNANGESVFKLTVPSEDLKRAYIKLQFNDVLQGLNVNGIQIEAGKSYDFYRNFVKDGDIEFDLEANQPVDKLVTYTLQYEEDLPPDPVGLETYPNTYLNKGEPIELTRTGGLDPNGKPVTYKYHYIYKNDPSVNGDFTQDVFDTTGFEIGQYGFTALSTDEHGQVTSSPERTVDIAGEILMISYMSGTTSVRIPDLGGSITDVQWDSRDDDKDGDLYEGCNPKALSCNYPQPGSYQIKIKGFNFDKFDGTLATKNAVKVLAWGEDFSPNGVSFKNAFIGWNQLNSVPAVLPKNVNNLDYAFFGATSFNGDLSGWDTSPVTSMIGTFQVATAFNGDLTNWNTSNVTRMDDMFRDAVNFSGNGLSVWDVKKVQSMNEMLMNAVAFNSDISNWKTDSLYSLKSTFEGATSFNSPLTDWNVANVIDTTSTFKGATSFTQSLTGWSLPKTTSTAAMFDGAVAFNGDVSGFNLSAVKDMSGMFRGASNFNQPVSDWTPISATNTSEMFKDAVSYNRPMTNFQTGNVTNMKSMFEGAITFNSDLSGMKTGKVTNMNSMFKNALSFNQDLNTFSTSKVVDMAEIFSGDTLFNGNVTNWNTGNVKYFQAAFKNTSNFNQELKNWRVVKAVNMSEMFSGSGQFTSALSQWKTPEATNMVDMFNNASTFTGNLTDWCVSKIKKEPSGFADNSSIASNKHPKWGTCPRDLWELIFGF